MQTTARAALIGLIAVALAACGGSGSGAGGDNGAGREFTACPTDPSGSCQDDAPLPPEPDPAAQCTSDEDCPPLLAGCSVCADGSAACARSVCEKGLCTVVMPTCPEPTTCGGIAGLPCAAGYVCEDIPNDACDPESGADCPGMCVPDKKPQSCADVAAPPCPEGSTCVDDPSDECQPAKGGVDCPSICQPISTPPCQSDDECPPLRAPCSACPDGTAACSQSTCVNGQCTVVFPTCPKTNACGGIAGIPCERGYECVDDPADDCDPSTAADCIGICIPAGPPGPPRCGGFAGETCPDGFECVDDPADDCDPTQGGADCGGLCQPLEPSQCKTDEECPQILAPCSICPDGTAACPRAFCKDGQCGVVLETCPEPSTCGGIAGLQCAAGYVCADNPGDECDPESGADCPGVCVADKKPPSCGGIAGLPCPDGSACVDDPGDDCQPGEGGADCPSICQPISTPQCQSDEECPPLRVPCSACPDGTAACAQSTCVNGQCTVVFPTCPKPTACGGIAGIPCERGYDCVDDPDDDCDPSSGADCIGICIPAPPPGPARCGGFAGETCPDGFECVDDPADDCDPTQGGADCGGLCQPVEARQCTTDEECPQVLAPCSICPDGTAACPQSVCNDGQCGAILETCTTTPQ